MKLELDPDLYILYKLKRKKGRAELIFYGIESDRVLVNELIEEKGWTAVRVGRDWVKGVSGGTINESTDKILRGFPKSQRHADIGSL